VLGREASERQLTETGREVDANDAGVADVGAGSDARSSRVAEPLVEVRADRHSRSREWQSARLAAKRSHELVADLGPGPPEERPPCPSPRH
jgi:hypothetical protein